MMKGIAWAFMVAVAAVWLLLEDNDEYTMQIVMFGVVRSKFGVWIKEEER